MGVTLDYTQLLKPYEAPTEPGGPKRTPEGQRTWLCEKNKIPGDVADLCMAEHYAEISAGQTYPDGHTLDRMLLARCQARAREDQNAQAKRAQAAWKRTVAREVKTIRQAKRPRNVVRHPLKAARYYWPVLVAYTLGAGSMAWLWWM